MKRRRQNQFRHTVSPESVESTTETSPQWHHIVVSNIPEAITEAIAMKCEEFIMARNDEQVLDAITVWKPQMNSVICSGTSQDRAKISRAESELTTSAKEGRGSKAVDKISHNSIAQEPSICPDPDPSHVSFSCDSIQDQSLARIGKDISKEMKASKSAEHRYPEQDHMDMESQQVENAMGKGESDPFVLLQIPTLENQLPDMNSSTESLRLSMEETEQADKVAVPEITKTILKNSEADTRARSGDGLQQQKKAYGNCSATQENNRALNKTSAQAEASSAPADNTESTRGYDSMCTPPASGHEIPNHSQDLSSDPLYNQVEVCSPTTEGCSFQFDEIGQSDCSMDDLDKSILAYAKHQQVPNTSVAAVTNSDLPGQHESLNQSGEIYVVHSTHADNNSESNCQLPALNLSPIKVDTSRAPPAGNRNEVLSDGYQQSSETVTQTAADHAVDADDMTDQMSTDNVIIISDSNKSSTRDDIIIVSSSSDRNSSDKSHGIIYNRNKKEEQRLLQLAAVDVSEADKGSLKVPSDGSIEAQDGQDECSLSILRVNTELTGKKCPQLNTTENLNDTEITHARKKTSKTRAAKHKGKQLGKSDLFSAFPRMPGWCAHSLSGKRELIKSYQRQQATEKNNVGKSPGKRKLYNRHDVLVSMSPDLETDVNCRTTSVQSCSTKSCLKPKKASVIPIGRPPKCSNGHSVIGYSRRPDFVAYKKNQCNGSNLSVVRDQQAVAEIYSICISQNSLKNGQLVSSDSCFGQSKKVSKHSMSSSVKGRHVPCARLSDNNTIAEPSAKRTCLNSTPERCSMIQSFWSDTCSTEKHKEPREVARSGLAVNQPQQYNNKSLDGGSRKEASDSESSSKHGTHPASSEPECISSGANAFQELVDTNGFVLESNSSLYKARFSAQVKRFVSDYVKQLSCK